MTMYASVTILIALLMIGMTVHVLTYSEFNVNKQEVPHINLMNTSICEG